jgi:large subunit ribosomal protein L11
MEFCKAFNAATQNFEQGTPIPTVITAYGDRTFTFATKTPPAAWFIQKAAKIAKGGATPSKSTVGSITMAQVREIAAQKMPDLNANDIDAAAKQIAGTARSMGVAVQE